jgi:hypothetical protein
VKTVSEGSVRKRLARKLERESEGWCCLRKPRSFYEQRDCGPYQVLFSNVVQEYGSLEELARSHGVLADHEQVEEVVS